MKLLVLGSSGGAPTKNRNCTSFIIKLESYGIMLDCSENTQRQLQIAGYKLSKIRYIFISHLHFDHIAGLIPMLSTKSMFGIEGKVTIVGPIGIKEFIEMNLKFVGTEFSFETEIIEIDDENEHIFEDFKINTYLLKHRLDCFGYRITFNDKLGNIIKEKLEGYGLTEGPVCGLLRKGEAVTLENGDKIALKDVASEPVKGKTIAYIGDTYLSKGIYKTADNADFMIIESTFQKEHEERAKDRTHLTSYMAGNVAHRANVKKIMLYHFSAAYPYSEKFRTEAAEKFDGEIYLAEDFMEIMI
ncbi:MAG: ribonuclease Z [Candidatus Delongbacteria bacterium]|nr:ribonuclease Z [Candidatus Delongbacteria bacterium]